VVTNKSLANTVVSDRVQAELLDEVRDFWRSEAAYKSRGLPYKRGYILHGPPGTGKTSLIKGLASEYKCDIVAIDMDNIKDNNQLEKVRA
jgi:chaperone BCS1